VLIANAMTARGRTALDGSDRWGCSLSDRLSGGDPFAVDHIEPRTDDDGNSDQARRIGKIAALCIKRTKYYPTISARFHVWNIHYLD